VINQVNTDGIMPGQSRGDFQLGAYPVDAGHQYRLLVSLEFKKPAKKADAAQNFGTMGRPSLFSNQFFGFSGKVNINTGGGIGLFNLPYLLCQNIALA